MFQLVVVGLIKCVSTFWRGTTFVFFNGIFMDFIKGSTLKNKNANYYFQLCLDRGKIILVAFF